MSKATKTLFFSLLIVTLVAILLNITDDRSAQQHTDGSQAELPNISEADRITIEHSSSGSRSQLFHNRESDDWEVSSNQEASAVDEETIEQFIEALSNIEFHREVTNDAALHSDYQVDERGTRISFYQEDNLVGGIILGRFNLDSAGNPTTFIRISGNNTVYTTESDMITIVANFVN